VNFSSIRAGLIEFRRLMRMLQRHTFIRMFCRPIWTWFLDAAEAAGQLQIPEDLAGGRIPVSWFPPRFEEVDRGKDAAADAQVLANKTTSLQRLIREDGLDPEEVFAEIEEEEARFGGSRDDAGQRFATAMRGLVTDALSEALNDRDG
jgi:capsid protein